MKRLIVAASCLLFAILCGCGGNSAPRAHNNRGIAFARKGELDKAISEFDEAIRLDPTFSAAFNNRGLAWSTLGEFDKAISDYNQAIQHDAKNASAYQSRGNARKNNGQYDKAIRDYTQAIRLNPKYTFAYRNRGDAWQKKGELDKAIKDYNQAIRFNPKYLAAYISRGIAWHRKGELDKAISDFNEVIRLDPKYAVAYFKRGVEWYDKGDYAKAISDFNEAIRLNPQDAAAHNAAARLQASCPDARFRDGRKAVENATKACELTDWKEAYAIGTLSLAHAENGDFDTAIETMQRVIEMGSAELVETRKKILAAFLSGKPYREESQKGKRSTSPAALAHHKRGMAWYEKGDFDKAISEHDEAIRLDPKLAPAYSDRGNAWRAKGELDKAISDYNQVIRLAPQFALGYSKRGSAWEAKGELDKAISDYNEAIRLDPKDAAAQNAVARLQAAIGKSSTSPDLAHVNRGVAWHEKGEYDKAISDFNQAIRLAPKSALAYYFRGDAWSAKGELDKAISDYNEAIRLNPKLPPFYNQIAWIQATCPDGRFRDGRKAVENATKACELTDWKDSRYLDTLAASHAENGDFDEAQKRQSEAIELAPAEKKADYRSRFELYKAHMPIRDDPKNSLTGS